MSSKCSIGNCYPDIRCAEGKKYKKDCPHWEDREKSSKDSKITLTEDNSHLLSWSGNSMGMEDISILSERSSPILLGAIGEANSGKTTFLGLLYLLLSNGQFLENWSFSNSYTILGWEYIANYLRYQSGNKSEFPPHTSRFDGRDVGLLHLGLFNRAFLHDIMFTDVPGEWFKYWAENINDSGTGNAPWIHKNSRGFLLFIDCEGLVKESGKYRLKTRKLINRLSNDLNGRPVAILWSKADFYDKIRDPIKNIIKNKLGKIPNSKEFLISIYHGNGNTYHKSILKSIDWLLQKTTSVNRTKQFEFSSVKNDDFFISYRGEL